jgi:diguanylate cyclase (GGDEF)-like protein
MERVGEKYAKEKIMTLFKQMGIAISFIIIIMLALVMAIIYQSTKKDMMQNVYETSVNNISTLSYNLAQAEGEEAHMSSIIDAAFDSGYYRLIEYHSSDGQFEYKQEDSQKVESVPAWFVSFTEIKLEPISEDVISGWETLGKVTIMGDTGIIYKSLYETFIRLVYLFVGFTLASLVLLAVMLSVILKPLREIKYQAEAITRDEFVFQEKLPSTTEFKEVVRAMNMMVKKVEYIFIKGSETVKRNQELLYVDPITELYNRRYLLLKLPDVLAIQNRVNGGTVIFVALGGAEYLNQTLGRESADKMFYSLGEIFSKVAQEFEDGVVARVNGTEFTLVLPNCDASIGLSIAKKIHDEYDKLLLSRALEKENVTLDIGMYRYRPNVQVSDLLTRADNALTQAKADALSSTYIFEEKDDENALGKEQWREIIEESVQKKHISLKFWPTLESRTGSVEHNVMTFTIDDSLEKQYFYGDFIAPAISLGLVSKIYMLALERLMTNKHKELTNSLCSVRLSSEFIKDPHALESLESLLAKYAKLLTFKLIFEIPDSYIVKNPTSTRHFIELFKQYGCGFGINAFTGESDDFAYLKAFNPIFIKSDVSFLLDQTRDSMGALEVIADSLGIKIIAASVRAKAELEALGALHIYKVQGPITDTILK